MGVLGEGFGQDIFALCRFQLEAPFIQSSLEPRIEGPSAPREPATVPSSRETAVKFRGLPAISTCVLPSEMAPEA